MSGLSLLQPQQDFDGYEYRAEIEQAIRDTRAAIEEALGYIERQEDGPSTMRSAIKDIDALVDAIETDVSCLVITVDELRALTATLRQQRNEAVHQRDVLIRMFLRK